MHKFKELFVLQFLAPPTLFKIFILFGVSQINDVVASGEKEGTRRYTHMYLFPPPEPPPIQAATHP